MYSENPLRKIASWRLTDGTDRTHETDGTDKTKLTFKHNF